MGNCVKRETGLEMDGDLDEAKERMDEIQKRIMSMKTIWDNRLASKNQNMRNIKMNTENIRDQINDSEEREDSFTRKYRNYQSQKEPIKQLYITEKEELNSNLSKPDLNKAINLSKKYEDNDKAINLSKKYEDKDKAINLSKKYEDKEDKELKEEVASNNSDAKVLNLNRRFDEDERIRETEVKIASSKGFARPSLKKSNHPVSINKLKLRNYYDQEDAII